MTEPPEPTAPPTGQTTTRTDGPVRLIALGIAAGLGLYATLAIGPDSPASPLRAGLGIVAFLGVLVACSANVYAIRLRTVVWGMLLQVGLALIILKTPQGFWIFSQAASVISAFLGFANQGSQFVFGALADPSRAPGGFIFAFVALPTIIFVSSFFTVLYYFGVLQFIVKWMARGMMYIMGTSGAETLSATANVFMGQTEAPLIVKPYVPRMTRSELLAMMIGGMATVSGGILAALVSLFPKDQQTDVAVALLTTSVMAAPCGLYVAKILFPETDTPATSGKSEVTIDTPYANAVDAASAGASDGMSLALNVAAMLIAFLAFVAMTDAVLGVVGGRFFNFPELSLAFLLSRLFTPVAALMGAAGRDVPFLADLLGTKLVLNEFVAFIKLSSPASKGGYADSMTGSGRLLATFALTSFANIGSIGIQIGGIGGLAPHRRGDIARLGGLCLMGGFFATLINACVASLLTG